MAQNFPTSAQIVYDTLNADATFTGYLGTYNFRSGSGPLPAMSIVTPGGDLPALRNVQGLECVIQDAGDATQYPYLSGDQARISVTWSVFLVCWEPSSGQDLQTATERVLQTFLGSRAVQTVATSTGLGSLVQNKIMIRSDMPIISL